EHLFSKDHVLTSEETKMVEAHAQEILAVNRENGLSLKGGIYQEVGPGTSSGAIALELPGHTESGGFVRFDREGLRHEFMAGGVEKISDADMTWGFHCQTDGRVTGKWGDIPNTYQAARDHGIVHMSQRVNGEQTITYPDGTRRVFNFDEH